MARTQAEDYEQKRDLITSIAAELFAEKGFAGASVSELAKRCRISKSLIYHYYPSKEAILFGVMSEHVDQLIELVSTEDGRATSPKSVLQAVTRALLECYKGAENHQKILLYELQFLQAGERKEIISKQRKVITDIEKILFAIAAPKKIDRPHLRMKTMLYFSMLNWTHTWFRAGGKISRGELSDEITTLIITSLENP